MHTRATKQKEKNSEKRNKGEPHASILFVKLCVKEIKIAVKQEVKTTISKKNEHKQKYVVSLNDFQQ